jgi:hypothetical protein
LRLDCKKVSFHLKSAVVVVDQAVDKVAAPAFGAKLARFGALNGVVRGELRCFELKAVRGIAHEVLEIIAGRYEKHA